jgi:hypothetical protein
MVGFAHRQVLETFHYRRNICWQLWISYGVFYPDGAEPGADGAVVFATSGRLARPLLYKVAPPPWAKSADRVQFRLLLSVSPILCRQHSGPINVPEILLRYTDTLHVVPLVIVPEIGGARPVIGRTS